jgi:iron complex outermembrane receptor protein
VVNVLEQKFVPANKDFAPPPAAYFLLTAAAGFKLPLGKNHKLGFQVAVENLLDRSYRDYLNRFRYYADDAGRSFILRIHYSF